MRPLWTGTITFGLVNIPVKLYSATQPIELDLDYLSKKGKHPIRYARMDTVTGKEVEWQDVVKGYEYQEGDYVVLDEEDFEAANLEKSKSIHIEYFVDLEQIDSKLFEKPYYLEPETSDDVYVLLRDALEKQGKVGVCEFVMRNREHLGILKTEGDLLVLIQLRYEDEIRPTDELSIPKKGSYSGKEMDLAVELIDKLTEKFDAGDFQDDYIKDLKKIIKAKQEGRKPEVKGKKKEPTKREDITSKLKESLE